MITLTKKERLLLGILRNGENGCWEWQECVAGAGYGVMSLDDGTTEYIHRVSYEVFHGAIPKGKEIDHICANRRCGHPEHIEAVSHRENMMRGHTTSGINAKKTHCWRGHPFDVENTRYVMRLSGFKSRSCRACDRIVAKRYRILRKRAGKRPHVRTAA